MPCETDIAWAAGLFEGEGSIHFYRTGWNLKLRMADLDVVMRFHAVLGFGSVRATKKAQPHHKQLYQWTCGKQGDCREIMVWFWPHLGERRRKRWEDVLRLRYQAFPPRICPSCGQEYTPIRKPQVCCSQKCAIKHTQKVGKYTTRRQNKRGKPKNGR